MFATPATKFTNIDVLTFYFSENHGGDATIVQYIGMQGEHTHYRREAVDASMRCFATARTSSSLTP